MEDRKPLKIGITCYPLIGGSGILATALGHELARRGNEVHFFSSSRPVRLDLSQPRIFFHEVVVNEYSLFKYPDYTLPLAVKMAGVAREKHLDVFHVHYAVPHATAAYLAVQMLGGRSARAPKIVTTLHGTDTTLLGQDPSYREAIEHALSESDAITTVSESLRRETLETFDLNKPVEVVSNFFIPAVPTRSRNAVRAELGVGEDEFLIVHTSNVRPPKRIDLLLRVFAAAQSARLMRLLILAGGSFAPHMPLLEELAITDGVIVKENVLDVEEYLAAADAGLYTSESESFGLSILETLFHAKPVVAFRVGGIPEVVTDGASGFLHPFEDIASMSASLRRLAESPTLATAMGKEGKRQAEARFSAEKIVPLYEEIYDRLVPCLKPGQSGR
ncbi:MAG: N-acetyl-alpha-D-glucosaminyl L-malate synthase BshA [Chthoniobacterales bacterium]|nr:N-acetyl-alpha-D-glucosaminyl L-malate synthase BshA [Chthoniobacterales bacterium]